MNFPKPKTVKELRRFLAIGNFYKRFIPYAARTQVGLNSYLKGVKRNDRTPILWSEDSTAAFEKCRKDLAEATVSYHPAADALLAILIDSSNTTVGSALHQQARTSLQCQRAKLYRHTRSDIGKFETPRSRFEHVHIDLVGPLPL
ncbi:retrovirus-related Pol polyprotein from transposon 297 [Nephila pilipes]|uniref:Retrovirus-related Pol polyprotein from transposon 297 n=1 Tax=Nephila pilipes TaxID=299642 RepID=A0A8X6TVI6_NEPPI|nr:retrovirus-related Pol polyprotein from transposon 297 [Nephila pilipes]